MSTNDLERVLRRWRDGAEPGPPPADARKLSVDEALAFRNAGNVPDEKDRSLRLVLHIEDAADLAALDRKRLRYEPDAHDAPTWRTDRSKPVNVVPLRARSVSGETGPWWTDEKMAALEDEWRATGRVYGVGVPAELRGFVYKTAVGLRSSGRDVTVESLCDSIARWVPAKDLDAIRAALRDANRIRLSRSSAGRPPERST